MTGTRFFHYRKGNSFLHKMNPALKIILLLVFATASFFIPVIPALIIWLLLIFISLAILKFRLKEVLTDLKPVLAYGIMLLLLSLILNFMNLRGKAFNLTYVKELFTPDQNYLLLFARLSLSIQISSILYRTTSTSEFSQAFRSMEEKLTKKTATPFSEMLSLTLTFIPRLADFWERISLAWKSRGGKKNLRRIVCLTPLLFKTAMTEAYGKTLARENRM